MPHPSPAMPHTPRPIRLVLDTNVVMDLLHFADPRTAALAAGLDSGRLQCFTDAECLAELARVAAYPAFALDAAAQGALLERYRRLARLREGNASNGCDAANESEASGECVERNEGDERDDAAPLRLPQCGDPDDQKFLVLAARCRADLLLTRDKALLRLAPPIGQPCRAPSNEPFPRRTRQRALRRLPFAIVTPADAAALLQLAPEDPAPGV